MDFTQEAIMNFVPPVFDGKGFNCPYCTAYAHMRWGELVMQKGGVVSNMHVSRCERCEQYALWVANRLVSPRASPAPQPAADMPADVKTEYLEAAKIYNDSPKASAALL